MSFRRALAVIFGLAGFVLVLSQHPVNERILLAACFFGLSYALQRQAVK